MLTRVRLGDGPSAHDLVRRAAGEPGLVALVGAWDDGGAVVSSRPVRVVADDLDVLRDVPAVPDGALGGAWFVRVDLDGAARLAWHDHLLRRRPDGWWFESVAPPERTREQLAHWRALLTAPAPPPSWSASGLVVPPRDAHLAAVERAVALIRAGELYQVNVCTRLTAHLDGPPAAVFADLAERLAPARAALVVEEDRALVGLSPELFLDVRGDTVRTSPIKGTVPRTGEVAADERTRERLRASVKDAAENVMIVDLVRNDLGRVCATGSVRVDALLDVEPHPGVWHLVSTVTGRLRDDAGVPELLRATLPPGSVTGAPKLRALEVVDEVEAVPRGAYTGTVGYVAAGRAEFAVTIRSLEVADGRLALGVGGGVTADSVPVLEWRECGHKAAPLLRALGLPVEPDPPGPVAAALLETVLVVDGTPLRLPDHLARLDRSLRELTGRGVPDDLAARARDAATSAPAGRAALRLVVHPDGRAAVTVAPVGPPPVVSTLRTVRQRPGVHRHKWADRAAYAGDEAAVAPDAPLYVAADGTVLETSRGNLVLLRPDGGLVTPPLRDDLLPGVTRRALLDLALDDGRPVELRTFDLAELRSHAAFWTSSLSLAVPVDSVDGHALPRADEVVRGFARRLGEVAGGKFVR